MDRKSKAHASKMKERYCRDASKFKQLNTIKSATQEKEVKVQAKPVVPFSAASLQQPNPEQQIQPNQEQRQLEQEQVQPMLRRSERQRTSTREGKYKDYTT